MSTTFDSGDTVMEMSFAPTETGTRVEIRQVSDTAAARDGAREGSEMLLEACAAYLAKVTS
jgi:hypothetical protein